MFTQNQITGQSDKLTLKQKWRQEKQLLKQEKNHLIMPTLLLFALVFMFLFGTSDLSANCGEAPECYQIDSQGNEILEFYATPPTAYDWNINKVDMDKLARAVARHETGGCTLGYGAEYNNCFGIKNGNTAPCKKIGRNRMCIYEHPDESYVAFKIIWNKWYKGLPTLHMAKRWSGNDNAHAWKRNVLSFYHQS